MINKRKYPAIDILAFYANNDNKKWNKFLYYCLKKRDVKKLTQMLYGFEAGMDDLAKKNLNTGKIVSFFHRIQRSIELTIKEIWREEFQNPLYDPSNSHLKDKFIDDKREKDHNLELFLKKNRF